jgi:hypothetical protein
LSLLAQVDDMPWGRNARGYSTLQFIQVPVQLDLIYLAFSGGHRDFFLIYLAFSGGHRDFFFGYAVGP